MAKIEKYLCDKIDCKRERAGDKGLHIFSHTTRDASGNGSEKWQAKADLCPQHLLEFTQFLIGLIEDNRLPKKLKDVYDKVGVSFELI
jgi:hypothetical protein